MEGDDGPERVGLQRVVGVETRHQRPLATGEGPVERVADSTVRLRDDVETLDRKGLDELASVAGRRVLDDDLEPAMSGVRARPSPRGCRAFPPSCRR